MTNYNDYNKEQLIGLIMYYKRVLKSYENIYESYKQLYEAEKQINEINNLIRKDDSNETNNSK